MDSTAPDPIARLLASPPDLPVVVGLPRLRELIAGAGAGAAGPAPAVVVTAPPGTGKTTLIPPLVADVVARLLPGGANRPRRVVVY